MIKISSVGLPPTLVLCVYLYSARLYIRTAVPVASLALCWTTGVKTVLRRLRDILSSGWKRWLSLTSNSLSPGAKFVLVWSWNFEVWNHVTKEYKRRILHILLIWDTNFIPGVFPTGLNGGHPKWFANLKLYETLSWILKKCSHAVSHHEMSL